MITTGREYKAKGDDARRRNIRTRRVRYVTAGMPSPFQKSLISRIERGVVDGDWTSPNPYNLMRTAETNGIDFYEEEKGADGQWHPMPTDDEDGEPA